MAYKYIHREIDANEINDSDFSRAIDASWPKMKDTFDFTRQAGIMGISGADSDETNKLFMRKMFDIKGHRQERLLVVEENSRQLIYQTAYVDDDNHYTIDLTIYGPNSNGSRSYLKDDVAKIRTSFRKHVKDMGFDKFAITISGNIKNHFDSHYTGESNDADNGVRDEINDTLELYKFRIPSE